MSGPAAVVLVHGAWHRGASWRPVRDLLARAGTAVAAPDLSGAGGPAGHAAAVDAVVTAAEEVLAAGHGPAGADGLPGADGVDGRPGGPGGPGGPGAAGPGADGQVVLVGHSLGGLVAPVAAARLDPRRIRALVLVAPFVPEPGRAYRDRLRADPGPLVPGFDAGVRRGDGPVTYWPDAGTVATGLYRGVADELGAGGAAAVATAAADLRPQDWTVLAEPCPLPGWPAVRTVAVTCAGDRVVDPGTARRDAGRVGAELVELPGGHFPMLTRPDDLAGMLARLAAAPD